eukprot:5413576-Pyramimonas_sp.AAC.1
MSQTVYLFSYLYSLVLFSHLNRDCRTDEQSWDEDAGCSTRLSKPLRQAGQQLCSWVWQK